MSLLDGVGLGELLLVLLGQGGRNLGCGRLLESFLLLGRRSVAENVEILGCRLD